MINNSEILLLWAGGLWFCGGVCIFVWSLFTALRFLRCGVVGGGVV